MSFVIDKDLNWPMVNREQGLRNDGGVETADLSILGNWSPVTCECVTSGKNSAVTNV